MKHWTTENREAAKGRDWAIETRGLTKEFDGERAVDGLDLTVPAGSVFGLMGPNGAGKSTIIRMLMGIILPTSGTGTILGREITDPSGTVRQDVGYVADFQHMYPFFRVEEILQFCARVYPRWDWKRCGALLRNFELPARKWVRTLSKGMKTQLALIIALSMRPRVLILDEPTSGLDPVIKHHFMQLIMQEAAAVFILLLQSFGIISWDDQKVEQAARYLSEHFTLPYYLGFTHYQYEQNGGMTVFWVTPAMLLVVFLCYLFSLRSFEKNPLEKNGQVLMFGNFPAMLKVGVSFGAALIATGIMAKLFTPGVFHLVVFLGVYATGIALFSLIYRVGRSFGFK